MKKLTVTNESETGLNLTIKDETTGITYTRQELIPKIKKNYGWVWNGFEVVTRSDGLQYIRTTEDNPNKLD